MADGSSHSSHFATTVSTTVSTTTTSSGPRTVTTSRTVTNPEGTNFTTSPQSTTFVHSTITTAYSSPQQQHVVASTATHTGRRPSIRVRRQGVDPGMQTATNNVPRATRRRSSSEPDPAQSGPPQDDLEMRKHMTATPLQTLHEEGPGAITPQFLAVPSARLLERPARPGAARNLSSINIRTRGHDAPEYEPQVVDMLDVIDPEVATLTTLNNVQNSLFIPNLGSFYRRQATYDLSQSSLDDSNEEIGVAQGYPEVEQGNIDGGRRKACPHSLSRRDTTATISSVLTGLSEGHNYAVLPHGASLSGWTAEEKAALNDHVRHLLHSRCAKFRRSIRGFGRYVRKPVGFLVSLYAFLLTFWGAAWVLFLIGWISVRGRQTYFIEICDQILTALFCVVGIGFAPWRAVDTYHMVFVARYAHLTWRLRKERGLPDLKDRNELPSRPLSHAWETGEEVGPESEEIVLTPSQQQKLEHHQAKLANSHSFYKPHETTTHHAFSLRLLIAIVVLLDCHSLFQMALGGTTWGIYYKNRPKALTAIILTCSISCNISAGITISIGDKRSRKRIVVEQMFRQGLTEEALSALRRERGLTAEGVETENPT
ncbi:uncharacterized protein BDR25DRAFT_346911 [Lindgomyces ingoldianus]|uniref:Uncharacterized protein n=1 Tax=Lindgomyces ingoldianus TaxID=673940 RepID=A0ACB6QB52_9PLEO|nr:uncharacterized protein BDR25DRAFT_346911 [Lindgomyces ingoldianus]KAF2464126.1 hypothetical protein BDR25DRAFT_346911 [Lindgomyces ingoldianus]